MTGRGSITAHGGSAAGCTLNVIVLYVSLLFMAICAATKSHKVWKKKKKKHHIGRCNMLNLFGAYLYC
jgi:hypothetical protein